MVCYCYFSLIQKALTVCVDEYFPQKLVERALRVYAQLAPVLLNDLHRGPEYLNYITAFLVKMSNTCPKICSIVDYRSIPLNSGLYLLQKRLYYIAVSHGNQSTKDNENMYHYLCTALSTLLGDSQIHECLTGFSNKTLI